jgi:hypothetical protein
LLSSRIPSIGHHLFIPSIFSLAARQRRARALAVDSGELFASEENREHPHELGQKGVRRLLKAQKSIASDADDDDDNFNADAEGEVPPGSAVPPSDGGHDDDVGGGGRDRSGGEISPRRRRIQNLSDSGGVGGGVGSGVDVRNNRRKEATLRFNGRKGATPAAALVGVSGDAAAQEIRRRDTLHSVRVT